MSDAIRVSKVVCAVLLAWGCSSKRGSGTAQGGASNAQGGGCAQGRTASAQGGGASACVVEDAGVLPGGAHVAPSGAWVTDATFTLAGGGPRAVRAFDSCAGSVTGDAAQCIDTIDYVDRAGQTRRLPYRITAPRDIAAGGKRLPVVLFQHGGGPNPVGQRAYDNLVGFLASNGYVVVQTAVMGACGATSGCANAPQVLSAYCGVYGQALGADCSLMNIMYFNRPNDFRATWAALPRIFSTIDGLAGNQSLSLATLADPELVAVAGHSAGTNGVLSLAGGGFDYVATPAGTDVNQAALWPTAFVAFGPNASSSDNGRGWDTAGFSHILPNVPFLFMSGSRDYAKDVPACDRPQSFFAAGLGAKFFHYEVGGTHASIPMNDEDNATVDANSQLWTPDRCNPNTSAVRGNDDFGLSRNMGASATALELSIYGSTQTSLLSFLDAELKNDPVNQTALNALPENTETFANFSFSTSSFERRGKAGPDVKLLGPSALTVGGNCGNVLTLRLFRRGLADAVTLQVSGLPPPAQATVQGGAASGDEATISIERGGAPAGQYTLQVTGSAPGGPVLGTDVLVNFP